MKKNFAATLLVAVFCLAGSLSAQITVARDILPAAPPTPDVTKINEYVVGEADVLRINVWKEPEISQPTISVRPDGMISIPLVGVMKVSGLTPSQIQEQLTTKLQRFIGKSQVTVSVVEIKSKFVYLTGQVSRPGAYPLLLSTDVIQLVIKGGGLTPFARPKSVVVLRHGNGGVQQKIPVNLAKVLRGEAPEENIELRPGDTVIVP